MPKLKTHRGAHKRLKITAKKKILHSSAFKRHLLCGKDTKRKRHLAKQCELAATNRIAVKRMLPYEF